MRKILFLGLVASTLVAVSCNRSVKKSDPAPVGAITGMSQIVSPANFNYRTTHEVSVSVQLNGMDNAPFRGVPVSVNKMVNNHLVELFKVMTDANGFAKGRYNVSSALDQLVICPNYPGFRNNISVPANNGDISITFKSDNVVSNVGYTVVNPATDVSSTESGSLFTSHNSYFTSGKADASKPFLSTKYSGTASNGVPVNTVTPDVVPSAMLTYIANSLPNGFYYTNPGHVAHPRVPYTHPSFLKKDNNLDIHVTTTSDVWVTYVYEDAGYSSSLLYYIYPTNTPPKTTSDIDTAFYVFPNMKASGLSNGTKVKIGTIPAGKSVGFMLVANGWSTAQNKVGPGLNQFFTNDVLDPEAELNNKQNSVLLWDPVDQKFIVAFDDQNEDSPMSDHDYNDDLFYVTVNPSHVDNSHIPLVETSTTDTDGDGVPDVYDDFPNDPTLAFKIFYPDQSTFGYLGFEDLWPHKGDYDFNDCTVGYQYEMWLSAGNALKEMHARFPIFAIGAGFYHGFGFNMNVPSSDISSVSYQYNSSDAQTRNSADLSGYSFSSNGTESHNSSATFLVFGNDYHFMNRKRGNFMNTIPHVPYVKPDTITLDIKFGTAIDFYNLPSAPFNPFIWSNGVRGNEIHLAGQAPTDLANHANFGKYDDATNTGTQYYYKTSTGLPWALDIYDGPFDYPLEGTAIIKGYSHFSAWATSGGTSYPNWYFSISGYRNNTFLYH